MNGWRRVILWGILSAVFLLPPVVRANEANYQHYQLGDRAAGMGGGISAMADGIDACFYNPAGLSRTKNNTLSLSANLYGFQQYTADDAMFPGESFETDSFHSVPSTAGGIFRLGTNWVASFSAFIPKKGSYFETIAFPEATHYYNLSMDFQTMWLGPSVGWQVNDRLSLGLSVFGVYDTYNNQQSLVWEDYKQAYALGIRYNSLSTLGVLGLQYRLDEAWSVGFVFQTPTANISSDGEWLEDVVNAEDRDSQVFYADKLEAENLMPAKFTLGISREIPGVWAVGADISYHLSRNYIRIKGQGEQGEELEVPLERDAVLDLNVGGEYIVVGRYPLRAGFFTSHSSAPDMDAEQSHFPAKINLYGLTCSVGTLTKNTAVSLGVNYIFGKGNDYGWAFEEDEIQRVVVDASERYLYFFFNTSYFF